MIPLIKPFFKNELSQSKQIQSRYGYTLFQQHNLPRLDEIGKMESIIIIKMYLISKLNCQAAMKEGKL